MAYEETRIAKVAEKLVKSGLYTMTGEEAESLLKYAASRLNVDLTKADLEKTREILSKGTPLSKIVIEMRER